MKQKIKKKGNNVTDETKLEKKMFQKIFQNGTMSICLMEAA